MQIAICDDVIQYSESILELLKEYEEEYPCVKFYTSIFTSPEELLKSATSKDNAYDLYLLDIIMPNIDGIALAQEIRKHDKVAQIVFLTHSESYALDAFRVFAMQYILKPATKEVLFPVLDAVIATSKRDVDKFFTVSSQGRTLVLLFSSIMVIEKAGRSLRFHLNDGTYVESNAIRTSFGVAAQELLLDSRFQRVHQSFVVNMHYVRELSTTTFKMENGMEIPIPRPKLSEIKKIYLKFISDSNERL